VLGGRESPDEIPLRYRRPMEIGVGQIQKEVCKGMRVPDEVLAKRRAGDEKKAAIYLARKLMRLGGREVGAAFGVKPAHVNHSSVGLITRHPRRLPAVSKGSATADGSHIHIDLTQSVNKTGGMAMPESESPKEKDRWDKADVVGRWLMPIAIAAATFWFDSALKERESRQKTFEVAIGILQAPSSADTQQLREWALGVFQKATGTAYTALPSEAIKELRGGAQLPSTSQLRLPTPGQLRVSIIRLEGASTDQSERIKSALIAAGYTNVATTERSQNLFPKRAEVRFYYPADSQNAQSLSDFINTNLGIPIQVNDRSRDLDAPVHRQGDLHVYVR
jgi:hypothetical protein